MRHWHFFASTSPGYGILVSLFVEDIKEELRIIYLRSLSTSYFEIIGYSPISSIFIEFLLETRLERGETGGAFSSVTEALSESSYFLLLFS